MKNCNHCNRGNMAAAARFCPECGAELPGPADVAPPPSPPPTTSIDVRQEVGNLEGGKATGVELGGVAGDVTVRQQGDTFAVNLGDVGAGAQVAVGKEIRQSGAGAAALGDADRAALSGGLATLREAVQEPAVPESRRLLAAEFVSQLEAQLLADGPPDAATLKVAGNWLLDNAPSLEPALRALFASPAGAKLLAAAGEPALGWAANRLQS